MATVKDFVQDNTGDLLVNNGDFVIDFSDTEHITDIISSAQGAWKEYPLCGVGIDNYLNSSGTQNILTQSIIQQLAIDGYNSIDVEFQSNDVSKFSVDAIRS